VNNVEATPTPSKVFIVQAADTVITATGSTTINATARTNGKPDVGLQVEFAVSGPGILSSSAAETDVAGIATVTLTGNNGGGTTQQTVTVTASTNDGRSGSVQIIVNAPSFTSPGLG
jgi:hypothetical protein